MLVLKFYGSMSWDYLRTSFFNEVLAHLKSLHEGLKINYISDQCWIQNVERFCCRCYQVDEIHFVYNGVDNNKHIDYLSYDRTKVKQRSERKNENGTHFKKKSSKGKRKEEEQEYQSNLKEIARLQLAKLKEEETDGFINFIMKNKNDKNLLDKLDTIINLLKKE